MTFHNNENYGMVVRYARNILIFAIIFGVSGEWLFRKRYAEPFRQPSPEIVTIQKLLTLDDTLGFHWKENVKPDDGFSFRDQDSETWPLSTDEHGFLNPPAVIERQRAGRPVNIMGLGDSFMEHAAYYIADFFDERSLNYYNLAIHRQTPPQFLDAYTEYGVPLDSDVVLLGISESDLTEIGDYMAWRNSGLDWFTFHSGTWCGPSLQPTPLLRARDRIAPGYTALFSLLESRAPAFGGGAVAVNSYDESPLNRWLGEFQRLTSEARQMLVVLFIPTKEAVMTLTPKEHTVYDEAMEFCVANDILFVDLHTPLHQHPTPSSLFYQVNGHWNGKGIQVAMEKVVESYPEILATGN